MAIISDTTKIDRSFKFVSGKSFTTSQKGVDNEDAPSGFIIGTSSIFSQDAAIPPVALLPADPLFPSSLLTFYGDGVTTPRFKMIYDISSPLNRAWYASSDGSSLSQMRATRQGNWVPTSFGNYTIRIFLTKTSPTNIPYVGEIFFSDATAPLFDYKSGILTFESDPLAAYASIPGGPPDGIQISGYRYIGPLLSQVFDANGNFTGGLTDLNTSTSVARFLTATKTLDVTSPHAIGTSWASETTPYGGSVNFYDTTQLANGTVISVGGFASPIVAYSYGQGIWQSAIVPGAAGLRNVWAASNGLNIYATDTAGNVTASTDSGRSWTQIAGSPPAVANSIWGSGTTNIYIVGNTGAIGKTTTGGSSWSSQTSGTANNLNDIWGNSSSDVFAVGNSGTVIHSTGSGTWTIQTSGTANNLFGIFGFSSTEMYACGASGTLLRSLNGTTWSAFSTGIPATFTGEAIYGVSSGGTKRIYVSGWDSGANNYAVYFSSGTNSWALQNTFTGPHTQRFSIYGGLSGIYAGLDSGRIAALHANAALNVHGTSTIDGYLDIGAGLRAQYADIIGLIDSGPITATATAINSVALQVKNQVNRDVYGASFVQSWYGLNNSGAQVVGLMDSYGALTLAGHIDMTEIASPSSPASAHGRIFFKSNGIVGAGHRTQLVVRWPGSNNETIIAESPPT